MWKKKSQGSCAKSHTKQTKKKRKISNFLQNLLTEFFQELYACLLFYLNWYTYERSVFSSLKIDSPLVLSEH